MTALLVATSAASAQSLPEPAELERRGARIGAITINVEEIFDLGNPAENKPLYRFANRAHIRTRETTVRSIILLREGDLYSLRELDESMRALRASGYISEAAARVSRFDAATNSVTVAITVKDAWSLTPELKLSRSGGENEWGVGLSEENLFGRGKTLTLAYTSDVDRNETFFEFFDPNVFGTRTRLNVITANTSDGDRRELRVGRPFFALDSRWAVEANFTDYLRNDPVYALGELVERFAHREHRFGLSGGWSAGVRGRRALRWLGGIESEEQRFAAITEYPNPDRLPGYRRFVYPWVGLQLIEDDFREMSELNDMGRTEDVQLGLELSLTVGQALTEWGSDTDAQLLGLAVHKGWEPGGNGRLMLLDISANARREDGATRDGVLSGSFRYFQRNLSRHLFSATLHTTLTDDLDAESQLLLGGDTGLRGYPLRFQEGRRSAALSVEQRFFTEIYAFNLIRVGYAVFFDIGRVWGASPRGTPNLGTLANVGAGLRLTSPRSSSRSVVHIDLAVPLVAREYVDGVQLTIEKKRSF